MMLGIPYLSTTIALAKCESKIMRGELQAPGVSKLVESAHNGKQITVPRTGSKQHSSSEIEYIM